MLITFLRQNFCPPHGREPFKLIHYPMYFSFWTISLIWKYCFKTWLLTDSRAHESRGSRSHGNGHASPTAPPRRRYVYHGMVWKQLRWFKNSKLFWVFKTRLLETLNSGSGQVHRSAPPPLLRRPAMGFLQPQRFLSFSENILVDFQKEKKPCGLF